VWAELCRLATIGVGAAGLLVRTVWAGFRKLVAAGIALAVVAGIIGMLISVLSGSHEPKTTGGTALPPSLPATTGISRPPAPVGTQAVAPAAVAAPRPAPAPASAEGSIFPLGAKAWVAPAAKGDDPSVGLFQAGTKVDILGRVSGPYGWDWLKLKGSTTDGQMVEAYVRADLVAGTNIKPQPGARCARDNGSEEYGRTPVYVKDVMRVMTGLRDARPDLVIARIPSKSWFSVGPSMRAANGWEWHTVRLDDGREGVIRADQLRPGPATRVSDDWVCQKE
jgi:hypothetical protein